MYQPVPMVVAWLCWVFGAIALGAGGWMFGRSWFADQPHGNRRCPKCWYIMTGVPGLVCPECGRAARDETELKRTRRHWKTALLGLSLACVGASSVFLPVVKHRGWAFFLPTAVLVEILPEHAMLWYQKTREFYDHPVIHELSRRIEEDGISRRSWKRMVLNDRLLCVQPPYPSSHDLYIGHSAPSWLGMCRFTAKPEVELAREVSWGGFVMNTRDRMSVITGVYCGVRPLNAHTIRFHLVIQRQSYSKAKLIDREPIDDPETVFDGEIDLVVPPALNLR